MKKVMMLLAITLLPFVGASAQKSLGYFNTFGIGLGAGTEGWGANIAAPIGNHFDISVGFDQMPAFKIKGNVKIDKSIDNLTYPNGTPFNVKEVEVEGNIGRTIGHVRLDYYPFNNSSFFIAAGFSFGGAKLIKLKGHSEDIKHYYHEWLDYGKRFEDVEINLDLEKYVLPISKNGDVDGYAKVSGFRPYVGLGVGRLVPKSRLAFRVELGAQFHGTSKLYYKDEHGTDQELKEKDKQKADDDFSKILNKLTIYPVLKFSLHGRIL
jgi:hypothetical protein